MTIDLARTTRSSEGFLSCPICQSPELSAFWPGRNLERCAGCGMIFRNPQPSTPQLDRHYREAYADQRVSAGTTNEAGTTIEYARIYVRRLAGDLGRADFAGERVLDVGAGTGEMSLALREAGAAVVAVEPFATRFCESRGIETYRSLESAELTGQFDGAVAVDVIEHMDDPVRSLKLMFDRLKPGGWLYLATLNTRGLNARVRRENWREARKPDHLFFYTDPSLRRLLELTEFAGYRRLNWSIRYPHSRPRMLVALALQALRLDSELRILCRRPPA
ncbi:MAG TPA: class I SAM-dependent methyltransferase [Thermomicrobiaceae bacterium]|nr:class I SAM-dependent methyltransferase [Thermomicrobiaceae bacterium]